MILKIIRTYVTTFAMVSLISITILLPQNESKATTILLPEEYTEEIPILLPKGYLEWKHRHSASCFSGLYRVESYSTWTKGSSSSIMHTYAHDKLTIVQYSTIDFVEGIIGGHMAILLNKVWEPFDSPIPTNAALTILYSNALYNVLETLGLTIKDEETAKLNCLESLNAMMKEPK